MSDVNASSTVTFHDVDVVVTTMCTTRSITVAAVTSIRSRDVIIIIVVSFILILAVHAAGRRLASSRPGVVVVVVVIAGVGVAASRLINVRRLTTGVVGRARPLRRHAAMPHDDGVLSALFETDAQLAYQVDRLRTSLLLFVHRLGRQVAGSVLRSAFAVRRLFLI